MKTLLFLLFSVTISAQPCTGCWGQNDTATVKHSLTVQDKQSLRLYSKLNWYDFSTYRFKGEGKRAVWISYAVAGILHGGREAYQADRTIFEKRLGVSPTSFFGSEQWVRQYKNHDPEQPHKISLFNGFRDYWHFSGATTKYILIGGAFTIGHSKQPLKYKILDTLIGFAGFSITANLTYNILR